MKAVFEKAKTTHKEKKKGKLKDWNNNFRRKTYARRTRHHHRSCIGNQARKNTLRQSKGTWQTFVDERDSHHMITQAGHVKTKGNVTQKTQGAQSKGTELVRFAPCPLLFAPVKHWLQLWQVTPFLPSAFPPSKASHSCGQVSRRLSCPRPCIVQ